MANRYRNKLTTLEVSEEWALANPSLAELADDDERDVDEVSDRGVLREDAVPE